MGSSSVGAVGVCMEEDFFPGSGQMAADENENENENQLFISAIRLPNIV